MALTKRQLQAREGKLTASRVACLMTANEEKIFNLWLEMTHDPSFVPEDFDDVWFVKLGEATEKLNLDWAERRYGKVVGRGKVVVHPEIPWAAATLDGWLEDRDCPIETKHNNGFETPETLIQRYLPQMHWQMICTDATECALSVIRGAKEPEVYFVEFRPVYATEMIKRATAFMKHVFDLTPPVLPPPPETPHVQAVRSMDMKANPEWLPLAQLYVKHVDKKKLVEKTERALKKLVPEDVALAYGGGIKIKRSKNGALSIKLEGSEDGNEDSNKT